MADIEETVDETMSVAPGEPSDDDAKGTRADAGSDESIAERLKRDPSSKEARLDRALDESMDASDPPSSTQPIHNQGPAPSSGFDEDAEKARRSDG